MNPPDLTNRAKFQFRNYLAIAGAASLWMWSLCIFLGTGLGYNRPVLGGLFYGGFLASSWRIAKGTFVGAAAWAVSHLLFEHFGEVEEDPYACNRR